MGIITRSLIQTQNCCQLSPKSSGFLGDSHGVVVKTVVKANFVSTLHRPIRHLIKNQERIPLFEQNRLIITNAILSPPDAASRTAKKYSA